MKRAIGMFALSLTAAWIGYVVLGRYLSRAIGARFAHQLLSIGQGKITQPEAFVHHRLLEALWLATAALLLLSGIYLVARWQQRKGVQQRWRWVTQVAFIFVGLNVLLLAAEHTVLFWAVMWQGQATQNLTRFYIKLLLAPEVTAPRSDVLVGSSQTRAQIDEDYLNRLLEGELFTTELHFPGSKAFDLYLIQPIVSRARPQFLVCYLTEEYFYGGSASEVQPNFVSLGSLRDLSRLGGTRYIPLTNRAAGIAGEVCPLFRLRDVIAQRLFGAETGQLKQRSYVTALETDLRARAQQNAHYHVVNDESRFQQRAFEAFVSRCEKNQQQLIVLIGQMNPVLTDVLDPGIFTDMNSFLAAVAQRHSNVRLVEDLPPQEPSDYEDLTHVTPAAQARFTTFLATRLRQLIASSPKAE